MNKSEVLNIAILLDHMSNLTPKMRQKFYLENLYFFHNYKFVYVDEEYGKNVISVMKRLFGITTNEIFSPFYSDNLYVLGEKIAVGDDKIKYFFDIFLDTNIVSYIYWRDSVKNPKIIGFVNQIIQKRNFTSSLNIDSYMHENTLFKKEISSIVYDNVYTFFNTLNSAHYKSKLRSKIKTNKSVKDLVENFKKLNESPYSDRLRYEYKKILVFLLKMSIISFSKKSTKNKLLELLEFQSKNLDFIDVGLTELAVAFYRNKNNIRLFGKIQNNRLDLIEVIENISWDLFHFRNLYNLMFFNQIKGSDVTICLMCSLDKKFIELKKHMSLQMVAINTETRSVMPFYKQRNIKKTITEEEASQFFNISKKYDRFKVYDRSHLVDVEEELKHEIKNML